MGSWQTLADPFLNARLVHPSLFMEGNSQGIQNDEVSQSPDTFEDQLRRKFGSICSDGKCHGEAAFFFSAGLNSNCSAAGELEGSRRGELELHRHFVHVEDARKGISNSLPGCYHEPVKLHNFFLHVIWQSLGECCFCMEADRGASFPVLVPAK